jgi:hypothetical protein
MRERVQVQGPRGAAPLQTVARPGAVSVGAPRVGSSRGEMLARSLAQIEPELGQHFAERQAEYEQTQSERARDTLQGMTFAEAKQMVESGTLRQTENPWYEAAFQKQYGVSYAGKRKRDIMLAYETQFDKHNGDIEGFIAGHVKRDASLYGENKFVSAGIREGMGDFLTRLRDQQAEFRAGTIQETAVDQFRGVARTAVDEAVAQGADPSASVRNLYGQHRQALGLSYKQMDDNVISLAEEYAASGDLDTVEALLTAEVMGEDGQKVGSFTSRARYAADANRILNVARSKKAELSRQAGTELIVTQRTKAAQGKLVDEDVTSLGNLRDEKVISQEMYESLLVQNDNAKARAAGAAYEGLQEENYRTHVMNEVVAGRGFAVSDFTYTGADGQPKSVKRDTVMDDVVNETLTTMGRQKYTEGEMAATLASWGVGANYGIWENALTDGYLSLGQALTKAGPDGDVVLPEPALAAYGTWKNLSEYPNLRARHVKDSKALKLYQDAEALERGGMEPETALLTASRIDRNASRTGLSTQLDRDTFTSELKRVTSSGGFVGFGTSDVANGGYVAQTVEKTARILVDAGLPPSRAVEQATRIFEESHTVINDAAVNTRNKLVPPQFEDMSEAMIDEFAAANSVDADDLTLVPSLDGEQSWVIAYKDTLLPHEEWVNGGSFNITAIQKRYATIKEEERSAKVEALNAELERLSYSYDEWLGMSRKERREADLPVSAIGGERVYRSRK